MAEPEHLRSKAIRLLAMAMKAYEDKHIDLADALIARAMQYLDEADAPAALDRQSQRKPKDE